MKYIAAYMLVKLNKEIPYFAIHQNFSINLIFFNLILTLQHELCN